MLAWYFGRGRVPTCIERTLHISKILNVKHKWECREKVDLFKAAFTLSRIPTEVRADNR